MDCVGFSPSSPQATMGWGVLVRVLGSTTKIPLAADLYPNEVRWRPERLAMNVVRPMSLMCPARPGNVNMSQ
eukprot:12135101-Alexandrium_andersonii.AAC.1